MMLVKKTYYYLKWYIPYHREQHPKLYKWVNEFYAWGMPIMFVWFVLAHILPQPNVNPVYVKIAFWTGLTLAGGSFLVLAGHCMAGLILGRYKKPVKIPRTS